MRTIALMNQKGGVGKTTTSVNLAAGLAARDRRVCLVDLDPQAHASLHFGIEADAGMPTSYDVFIGRRTLAEARRPVSDRLCVVPAHVDLAAAEMELAAADNRETILREQLSGFVEEFPLDYLIVDCPPSLGVLPINALAMVGEVIIPLQPHFLGLQGLSKLLETIALVTRQLNPQLVVSGIALCLYDTGTRLAADVTDDLQTFLDRSHPRAPWANARLFRTRIRRNIRLAEAAGFGQPIFDYAAGSAGAADYAALVEEVIEMEASASSGLRPGLREQPRPPIARAG